MDNKTVINTDPYIKKFINILLVDYGIDENEDELYQSWLEVTKIDMRPKDDICSFILLKGTRKGSECGIKRAKNSTYCIRHSAMNVKESTVVLKKHICLKKFWDPITRFVYEDPNKNIVIGKTTKATKGESCPILSLTDSEIEKCVEKGLIYKKSVKSKD